MEIEPKSQDKGHRTSRPGKQTQNLKTTEINTEHRDQETKLRDKGNMHRTWIPGKTQNLQTREIDTEPREQGRHRYLTPGK